MRRIIETSLGVSFKTCLTRRMDERMWRRNYVSVRSRHDDPLWHRGDVPVRRLGDVPLRSCWVFHLRRHCHVIGTYQDTLLRRRHDVSLQNVYEKLIDISWNDDYTTGNLFDFSYHQNYYKLIGIDLSRQKIWVFLNKLIL